MFNKENNLLVRFYPEAVQNKVASDEAGRPIFEDKDFIHIVVPGDPSNTIQRPIRAADKSRFPNTWNAYAAGKEASETGTPVEHWHLLTKAQAMELKAVNINTVESLVEVSDANLQRLGPGYKKLQAKARDYLASADVDAKATAWAREKEKLEERIRVLEDMLEHKKKAPKTTKAA